MDTIPHGVTIMSYTTDTAASERGVPDEDGVYSLHTWYDLHLIPVCRPIVQPPLEKTMTLDIEGRSGVADLSHSLTGYPIFKDREGSWQFWLDTDSYQEKIGYYGPVGDRAYREIQAKLTALMRSPYQTRIVLDDEPSFYYIGRIWLDGKPSYQYDHAKFTLRYRLYPYKYLRNEYGKDWIWDTFRFTTDFADSRSTGSGVWKWDSFCFDTDLATAKMKDVALKAGQSQIFPLVFTDKPSAVFVTSTGSATANLTNQNGQTYTLLTKATRKQAGAVYRDYKKKEVRYSIRTHRYLLALEYALPLVYMEKSGGTVKMAVYRKGSDVSLAVGSYKATDSVTMKTIQLHVSLEPETEYVLVISSDVVLWPQTYLKGKDSTYLAENEYFSQTRSDTAVYTTDAGDVYYPLLGGSLVFYAGQGAALEPGVKTNIGTVGRNVSDNSMSVTVTAAEDSTVNIDYCPAYL